jgi:hypothetical protein
VEPSGFGPQVFAWFRGLEHAIAGDEYKTRTYGIAGRL